PYARSGNHSLPAVVLGVAVLLGAIDPTRDRQTPRIEKLQANQPVSDHQLFTVGVATQQHRRGGRLPEHRRDRVDIRLAADDEVQRMLGCSALAGAGALVEAKRQRADRLGDQPGTRPHGGQLQHVLIVDVHARRAAGAEPRPGICIGEAERGAQPAEHCRPNPADFLRFLFHPITAFSKKSVRSWPSPSVATARPIAISKAAMSSILSGDRLRSGAMFRFTSRRATRFDAHHVSTGSPPWASLPATYARSSACMAGW